MKCEKMGISVALFSALAFVFGWYSLTMVLILMLAVICCSNNDTLRKNVMTAFMFSLLFWAVTIVLNYISGAYINIVYKIGDLILKFFKSLAYSKVSNVEDWFIRFNIFSWIVKILNFAQFVLMIIFVIMSFKGKEVKAPIFANLASRAFGIVPPKKEKKKNPITDDEETLEDIPKSNDEEK